MTFNILWTPTAKLHLDYWKKHDSKKLEKVKLLCQSIAKTPTEGIGKPERLKFLGNNIWSRRIDQEHRLVYQIKPNKEIFIIQCKFHY